VVSCRIHDATIFGGLNMSDKHADLLDFLAEIKDDPEMKAHLANRKPTIILVGLSGKSCLEVIQANKEAGIHSTVVVYNDSLREDLANSLGLKSLTSGRDRVSGGELVKIKTFPVTETPNYQWTSELVDPGEFRVAGIVFAIAKYDPASRWDDAGYYLNRDKPQFERIPAWYIHQVLADSLGLAITLVNAYYDELTESDSFILVGQDSKDETTQIQFVTDFLGTVVAGYFGGLFMYYGADKVDVQNNETEALQSIEHLRKAVIESKK